ncbi:MAG: enoyl-CoA hydratase/isomerase family protein [bacterium]
MSTNEVIIEKRPYRWDITLNRPPLNILTSHLMEELIEKLKEIDKDNDVKLIVIWGNENAWSAGADVKEHLPGKFEEMLRVFSELCEKVRTLPTITIAAVDGLCLGGGCELAAMCDLVIATERARFGQPEVKVGVFPPIACAIYPSRLGWSNALYLLATGETISAQEANKMGLVFEVVSSAALHSEIDRLSELFNSLSAEVLRLTKRAAVRSLDLAPSLAVEEALQIYQKVLMSTRDAGEGLQAFLEKRKPVWQNR